MILQTGGLAFGATSTRSRSASAATRSASSMRTIPTCSPPGPINRTSGTRMRSLTRVNERIRVTEVRFIGQGGEQVGIVRIEDALRVAADADLDLVEVAPNARPPVCKIMDYGKYKYEAAQKARESRRNQQQTVVKEQKLRPKIDDHD